MKNNSYKIFYKSSKTKRVLNCNSCWPLLAQATNGTEAHMNMHGPHGCRWCLPISKAHTPQPPCAHIFLKCTPISKSAQYSTTQRPHVPPAAWLFHAGCSWVPERCFCLCLLLTLVDVCGTNTPVILLSENVFLPKLHQPAYDQYKIAIYHLDTTLFDK